MTEQVNTSKEALESERSVDVKASLERKDPEVPAIPQRRRFTKEYKLKVLQELESCTMHGGRSLILRREGLYSSQIAQWKKSMDAPKKQSNKKNIENENARLKRRVAKLEATVEKKDYIIEAQKKMNEIIDNLNKASETPPLE